MEYILEVNSKNPREMNPKKERFEVSIRCLNDVRDSEIALNKLNKKLTRITWAAAYSIARKWNEEYTKMGHKIISNTVKLTI